MSDQSSCRDTCTAPCAAPPSPIALADALERFARGATHGVCDTGRARISYAVWGDGPPLVFLHGLADTSRSFIPLMAHLSPHFRCIAYDLPTGHEFAGYRHADLVFDLWALLDLLNAKQAYLFAMSFGSTVALAAMHQRPARLPRAVLQSAVARKPLARAERFGAWLMSHFPGQFSRLPLRDKLTRRLHQASFSASPPEVWDYFLSCSADVPTRAVGRQARMLHSVDLRPILGQIRPPILLLRGDGDPIVSAAEQDATAQALPNAAQATIENCGHVPCLTHTEPLARLIRRFLSPPTPCAEYDAACQLPSGVCSATMGAADSSG